MSSSLLDSVRSVFPETLIAKFSALPGEPEANINNALHGAIPMVLTDILHKSYFPEGIAKVSTLAKQAVTGDFFGQLHELWLRPTLQSQSRRLLRLRRFLPVRRSACLTGR